MKWWVWPTAAFAATRIWLLLIPFGAFAYPGGTLVINDVELYAQWAVILQSGQFPVNDQMWQYPPLIGPLMAFGALLPPSPTIGLVLLMLAFDAGTFAVLMRATGRGGSAAGPWTWIIAGMLVGPVWLTRFDVVPTLLAVLALLAISRPLRAGALLGVGALLKVWPGLLLLALPRRQLPRALIGFAASAATLLIVLSVTMSGVTSFASEQRERGLQVESVPAWFFLVGHHLGWSRRFEYRYGAMEVIAQGTGAVALAVTAVGALGLAAVLVARLTGRLERARPADVALTVVLLSMVTSRVLSPQYLVWVAGIAAVCMLDRETLMRPVVALLAPVALFGQVLYPMHYDWLLSDRLPGLFLQTVRVVLLVVAVGWALTRLFRVRDRVDEVRVHPVEQVGQAA